MTTLLYILRHGQSDGNARRAFLGHTDLPLTDLGRRQAMAAGAYLQAQGIMPDVLYASPLCRAYETAVLAAAHTDLTPVKSEDLQEIYAGEWENLYFADIARLYADDFEVWHRNIGYARPTGGESVAELQTRTLAAFRRIAAAHPGQTVLIGTHATPLRMLETYARGWSLAGAKEVPWPTNASLSAYLFDGEKVTPLFYSFDGYEQEELAVRPSLG